MVELPPALLYAFGAILIVFGSLRAYVLGWSRVSTAGTRRGAAAPVRELPVDAAMDGADAEAGAEVDEPDQEERRTGYSGKKHLAWGLVWVGLGLFVVITTAMRSRGL